VYVIFDLLEGKVIDSPIFMADQGGAHALVHFIQYKIDDQPPVGLKLYGMAQRDFAKTRIVCSSVGGPNTLQ